MKKNILIVFFLFLQLIFLNHVYAISFTATSIPPQAQTPSQLISSLNRPLPYIAYASYDPSGSAGTLKLAHCKDNFCTNPTIQSIAPFSDFYSGSYYETKVINIVKGRDGLPTILFHQNLTTTGIDYGPLRLVHCGNQNCSQGNTFSNLEQYVYTDSVALAIGSDGNPIVAITYVDPNDTSMGHLAVYKCNDVSCSSFQKKILHSATFFPFLRFQISLTVGSDGLPVLAYAGFEGSGPAVTRLVVVHCGSLSCNNGNTSTDVAFDHDILGSNQIIIGQDGKPFIIYYRFVYSADVQQLKAIHCGNVECSSGNTATVIEQLNWQNVAYSSVALGYDGLPIISYVAPFVGGNNYLKVAKCNDVNCVSTTKTLIDVISPSPAPLNFWHNSVAIGRDNLPIVSYTKFNSSPFSPKLSVVHCGNQSCSSGNVFNDIDTTYNSWPRFSSVVVK